ncbi:MAG TPA: chemotaxis protein CheW [Sideroxyarcus sp.]|nr:chemotaxis protein CheW [Sideroxyarcus sp.]
MAAVQLSAQAPDAWLLDFGQSFRAAVGKRVMVQIIDDPKLHAVPRTPAYCRSTVLWQGRVLPVMDMAARLGGAPQAPRLLAIAAYHDQTDKSTRFGALLLDALPAAIVVGDAKSCPLPEQSTAWDNLSLSCFEYQGAAVPVLHLARVFAHS